ETLANFSGGMCVKSDRDENGNYAAQTAMMKVIQRLKDLGVQCVDITFRSRGGKYNTSTPRCVNAALKMVPKHMKLSEMTLQDVTPYATGTGCRVKGGRRGRKV
ncbi:MAG: hypothetical protein MHPSP_001671, partial [Paramarteilia canceri]